jgi:hypothetical protein
MHVAVAVAAGGIFIGAAWAQVKFKTAQPTMQVMVSNVKVSLSQPLAGTRLEQRMMLVRGQVEGTGVAAGSKARIEMGFKSGIDYVASKTILVRVGSAFSAQLEMPGDGPYQFYIGVVRLENVVLSDNVAVRPREGRDLSAGTVNNLRIVLADERGRRLDGRVVVYRAGAIIGETNTAAGRAEIYDLAAGEYQIKATSNNGWTAPLENVRVSAGSPSTYIVTLIPPELY